MRASETLAWTRACFAEPLHSQDLFVLYAKEAITSSYHAPTVLVALVSEYLDFDLFFGTVDGSEDWLKRILISFEMVPGNVDWGVQEWRQKFQRCLSAAEACDSVNYVTSCLQMSLPAGKEVLHLISNQIPLTGDDFVRLSEGRWLNDEIVNAYFLLISELAYRECCSSNPGCDGKRIEIEVISSFCFVRPVAERKKFFQRLRCQNVFTLHMLMFPIHTPGHWIVAVVNFRRKRIEMYDSLRGCHREKLKELLAVLEGEAIRLGEKVDFTMWALVAGLSPKQENGSDCGMFACTTAVYLAQNLALDYTQRDIWLFRLKMVRDLRRGYLDQRTSDRL